MIQVLCESPALSEIRLGRKRLDGRKNRYLLFDFPRACSEASLSALFGFRGLTSGYTNDLVSFLCHKQREHEKQQRQLEYKIACEKADAHHCCILLRRFGLEPWKRLVEINKLNAQIAEKYYARTVFRNYIQVWKQFTDESKREKILYADECFRVILLRRSFKAWKKVLKLYLLLRLMI